jgi:site-specific DNA-cytosine methylase
MSKALSDTAKTTRSAQAVNILRSEVARSQFIAHVCCRADASSSDKSLIVFNLEERASMVGDNRAILRKQAKQIINQLGKLAGPRALTHVEPARSRRGAAQPPHLDWRDTNAPPLRAAQRPPLPPRTQRIIEELDLGRLDDIASLTVICPERAAARVAKWRKKSGDRSGSPPLWLLREILHTESIPTALASPSDHFYLPEPNRWVTIAELLTLFQVPANSAAFPAIFAQTRLTERQLAEAIGRAMFPPSVEEAIRRAVLDCPVSLPDEPRFATACSGLDFASVAMDNIFGSAWHYVAAAESDRGLAAFLALAYTCRGLTSARVACDCVSAAATRDALPADIFVAGPPCGPWSQRNHSPSWQERVTEVDRLDACLDYVRCHRPAIVIIENVDTADVTSAVVALLASLPGYITRSFVADARDQGPMCRKRRYYYAVRKSA